MDRSMTNAELAQELGSAVAAFAERLLEVQPKPKPRETRLLTAQEVADRARVSVKTICRDTKTGKLPCTRLGRRVLFREDDVNDYTK